MIVFINSATVNLCLVLHSVIVSCHEFVWIKHPSLLCVALFIAIFFFQKLFAPFNRLATGSQSGANTFNSSISSSAVTLTNNITVLSILAFSY